MMAGNILTENPHLYKDFAGPTAQIYIFAYFSNPRPYILHCVASQADQDQVKMYNNSLIM